MSAEVIVAGAGPVGLSLALGLARRGRRILVLEKKAGTAEHSRAPAIWPGTQEILDGLGVLEPFLEEGLTEGRLCLWDADHHRALLQIPLEELAGETRWPQLLILPQSRAEALLLEALRREPSAQVLFNCEVTAVVQGPEGVSVEYREQGEAREARAAWLAGCDGAHSAVRKALGATLQGITYSVRAALADVEFEGGGTLHFPRLTTRPRLAVGLRLNAARWRLILPYGEKDGTALGRRIDEAVDSLFHRSYRTVWQSEFRLHRRISSSFGEGRVVLAGDAAHLNSPVGGQGMNAGIRDSALLAAALEEALSRDSSAPLDTYRTARREEVGRGVNRFTHLLTRFLLLRQGRLLRPLTFLAGVVLRVPALRRRFLRRLAMLQSG